MLRLLMLLCCAALFAAPAAAIGVTIAPDRVLDGDEVTIALSTLPNGTVFSLRLESEFDVAPGGAFVFSTDGLVMPFSLEKGTVGATVENTAENELVVRKGETQARVGGLSKDGRFSTEQNVSITAGTYDGITLGGTALPDATTVRAGLSLTGIKQGPGDATISFTVRGVSQGTLRVSVYANSEKVHEQTLALGAPTTAATTSAPTTTAKPAGVPFAFAAIGALGIASLLLAGRFRR